ncbi:DUF3667 domain-containing protein [Sphingomicrobium flavum]|uniref:DUF3667 domain-containing protein n=1 Tax=Sphingomicrobium flavum TaxID=1229164 RepID=UPI0021AD5090|nr:DUF3667 domain-containing protein [Sphingomicrobium flavum]
MGGDSNHWGESCQSCGTLREGGEYCPRCGEKRYDRDELSMHHVIEHGIEGFTHFDYKIPRTAWSLLRSPGTLERDLLDGQRVGWAKPFPLFVIVNLIYYFLATILHLNSFNTPARIHMSFTQYRDIARRLFTEQAAAQSMTLDSYIEQFDALSASVAKTLPFLIVILLTLFLGLMLWRSRRYLVEHFYVALVWVTRMLIIVLLTNLAMLVLGPLLLPILDWSYDGLSSLIIGIMLSVEGYGVFRKVYDMNRLAAVLAGTLTTIGFLVILMLIYRPVLMLLTMALL